MTEQVNLKGWDGSFEGCDLTLAQKMEAVWRMLLSQKVDDFESQRQADYIYANIDFVRTYRRAVYRRVANWRGRKFNYHAKAAR